MTFVHTMLLYFCTVVSALYLVGGVIKPSEIMFVVKLMQQQLKKSVKQHRHRHPQTIRPRSDNGEIYLQKENIHARD